MATTEEEDVTVPEEGIVAQYAGKTYRVVADTVAPTRERSLWPFVLVVGLGAASALIVPLWASVVASSIVAALAYWLGARG